MKPTDEKSGVWQRRGHKVFGCPPTPASQPDAVSDEAAIFEDVYTLLGNMAAAIGQPRGFNFRDLTIRGERRAEAGKVDLGCQVVCGCSLRCPWLTGCMKATRQDTDETSGRSWWLPWFWVRGALVQFF
jgi:hypothetical protein